MPQRTFQKSKKIEPGALQIDFFMHFVDLGSCRNAVVFLDGILERPKIDEIETLSARIRKIYRTEGSTDRRLPWFCEGHPKIEKIMEK